MIVCVEQYSCNSDVCLHQKFKARLNKKARICYVLTVCACMRAYVRGCVRACVGVCVCVWVGAFLIHHILKYHYEAFEIDTWYENHPYFIMWMQHKRWPSTIEDLRNLIYYVMTEQWWQPSWKKLFVWFWHQCSKCGSIAR